YAALGEAGIGRGRQHGRRVDILQDARKRDGEEVKACLAGDFFDKARWLLGKDDDRIGAAVPELLERCPLVATHSDDRYSKRAENHGSGDVAGLGYVACVDALFLEV